MHKETVAMRRYRQDSALSRAEHEYWCITHPESVKDYQEWNKKREAQRKRTLKEQEIGCDILCAFIKGRTSEEKK